MHLKSDKRFQTLHIIILWNIYVYIFAVVFIEGVTEIHASLFCIFFYLLNIYSALYTLYSGMSWS